MPEGHRIIFVRHGAVTVNGTPLAADASVYRHDAVTLAGAAPWSQLWRWELSVPNAPASVLVTDGALSQLRMARTINTLDVQAQSQWLFRLDRITTPAGAVTERHRTV